MSTAIVGNAPLPAAQRDFIESFDRVIRFNSPPPSHIRAGMRTDLLYIINTAKQTPRRLNDQGYLSGPVFSGAQAVCLPFAAEIASAYLPKPKIHLRLVGRKRDYAELCRAVCSQYGKTISVLAPEQYESACSKLGIVGADKRMHYPSSGFLAIVAELECASADEHIHLFGFGFEGWKRHKWAEERAFVLQKAPHRLVYHAPT